MKTKIPLNIPNILSLYRLLSFPFVLAFIIYDNEVLFAWFFCINLITDVLDGFIARRFNMKTEIGAKLDSMADIGTFILGLTALFVFKIDDIGSNIIYLYFFTGAYLFTQIFSLLKFKKMSSFHLYSWKIAGYVQGIFFFTLFSFGYNIYVYFFAIIFGYLAFTEHFIIQLILKEMKSNQKGLYWVLKK